MEAGTGKVDDLAALAKLTEQTLLKELELRYGQGQIYTYIGDILVAVNPFQQLPLYDSKHSKEYRNIKVKSKLKPHIFAVADCIYQDLLTNKEPQCCVVSGESGAGKTETTKLLVRQIVQLCTKSGSVAASSKLHDALIEINPLMEAFGNAQTKMNGNSSRFGKYIELLFSDQGELFGGRVSIFLLEKTRVTGFNRDEQNFHIFYHMFAGLSERQRTSVLLTNPDRHRILKSGDSCSIFTSKAHQLHHKAMFIKLQKILTNTGFLQEDCEMIYAYLSAILHLTDIQFEPDQETDGVFITDEYPLHVSTELLGVSAEEMATALISNVHLIRGETIVNLKNLVQAGDGRDALAKALYSRLFGWIISKINNKLKPDLSYAPKKSSCPVIGLLDIAGFENFTSNSFEQLCINTSNEQLQHYFNQHVFAWEKRDLDKEGVKTSHISFTNNSEILGMFIERPLGLYALIDEESKFPKATANSLLEKVRKHLIKYSCIKKEKGREPLFTIQHYAGPVTYSVSGMLETNRDTLSQNILECLERSESGMIYQLFSAQFSDNGELSTPNQELRRTKSILMCKQPTLERGKSLSKTAGRKVRQNMKKALKEIQDDSFYKHRTVGSQFQDSLAALMTKLMQCQPHFIRCIKPNTSQASQLFERKLVSQQLRYTGILETVRIRHEGFPVRLSFQVFLDRYKFISYPLTAEVEAGTAACHTVLREAGLHKWELGTRKVFLRYWHPEQLKLVMERRVRQVVLVQSLVRRFIGCRKVQQLRQILEARKQAQAKSFLMMVAERSQQMHADLKELHNLDVTKHKQSLNNLAREAEESKIREQMIEEKRRKLALAEAEREKKAAELRLAEAQKRIEELETTRKVETPSSISSSSSSGFEDDLPSPKLSKEEPKHTWRKQRANHKDHVAGLRNLLESKAEPPDQENVRLNKQKWVPISERLYATPACPYGVARKSPARPLHLQSIFSDPSHGQVYDPENVSHYARQSSHSKILVNKVEHYNGLIQEALQSESETQNKSNWGKLVYMEKSQRCASFILTEPVIKIDGAHYSSDPSSHVALNSVENLFRDEQVGKIREYIGKGMQLQIDTEGDIWAKKLGMNDIIVQDHNDPSLSCISEEVIKDRGRLQKDKRVKIFDMKEFRSHVILEMHKAGLGRVNLKDLYSRCCIVSLTLVKSSMGIMETPCWINIINLGALRMLRDENVMADFEKELKKIMRSNIDFTKISQLPQIDKQKPKKTDKKKGKLPQRKNQEADKVFVLPEPVLDRASKPVGDFQFKSPRKWAKLKQNGVSQLTE